MSVDEKNLAELIEATPQAGLQVILIGNVAAMVQGAAGFDSRHGSHGA